MDMCYDNTVADMLREWRCFLAEGGDPSSQDSKTIALRNKLLANGLWQAVYALEICSMNCKNDHRTKNNENRGKDGG